MLRDVMRKLPNRHPDLRESLVKRYGCLSERRRLGEGRHRSRIEIRPVRDVVHVEPWDVTCVFRACNRFVAALLNKCYSVSKDGEPVSRGTGTNAAERNGRGDENQGEFRRAVSSHSYFSFRYAAG